MANTEVSAGGGACTAPTYLTPTADTTAVPDVCTATGVDATPVAAYTSALVGSPPVAASASVTPRPKQRPVIRALVCLLPMSALKTVLLRAVGYTVEPGARMHAALIWRVDRVELGEGSTVRLGNVIRDLTSLELAASSSIGRRNWISGSTSFAPGKAARRLALGAHATVGSKHYIDCTGGVTLGSFASLSGQQSSLLTHGVDYMESTQTSGPVSIGDHSVIESHCTILADTVVEDHVLVRGGALVAGKLRAGGLYVGGQARRVRDVDAAFFKRTTGFIAPEK